ncbi:hypothetical protein DV515_00003772 [Chloebia gouldiae]|uniref:Uncharacterized protein n=1 Tax=Chloebia gouldiae TaxID=44316 RepID=A0A3L8ST41_CHLGU|nr:hypothetical protein DV515_00003772 [Chloebia gouldiae]
MSDTHGARAVVLKGARSREMKNGGRVCTVSGGKSILLSQNDTQVMRTPPFIFLALPWCKVYDLPHPSLGRTATQASNHHLPPLQNPVSKGVKRSVIPSHTEANMLHGPKAKCMQETYGHPPAANLTPADSPQMVMRDCVAH